VEDPKDEDFAPLNLGEIVQNVKRYLALLLVPPLLLIALAAARYWLTPTRHVASTVLLFNTGASDGPVSTDHDVQNEIALAKSDAVRDVVTARLGSPAKLTMSTLVGSNAFTMHVTADDADRAVQAVTAYAEAYVSLRAQRTAALGKGAAVVRDRVSAIQKNIAELDAQIADALVAAARADPTAKVSPDAELVAQRDDLRTEQDKLRAAVTVETEAAAVDPPLVTAATAAATSTTADLALAMVLAALGGLAIGTIVLLLAVALDETVHDRAAVEQLFPQATLLAECIVERRGLAEPLVWPWSPSPDGFQALQAAVNRACRTSNLKSLAVIACEDSSASTTALVRLGGALAVAGRRVVAVDADLSNPGLRPTLQLDHDQGLMAVFAEHADPGDLLQHVAQVPDLLALTAGPGSRAQQIQPKAIARAVRAVADQADVVLIDAPSAVGGPDGIAIASLMDGVVIVVVADQTTESHLTYATQRLAVSGAHLVGVVFVRESRRRPPRRVRRSARSKSDQANERGPRGSKPRSPVESGRR
jgi:Mrp family chromosome partitioning ATPase